MPWYWGPLPPLVSQAATLAVLSHTSGGSLGGAYASFYTLSFNTLTFPSHILVELLQHRISAHKEQRNK